MIATVTLNPSLDKTVTVDRLVLDEANRWTSLRRDAGGKGINVSRVLHELKCDTTAYGFNGGLDGEVLSQLLRKQGVPFDFTHIDGEIRSNLIITIMETRRQTRIDAPGPSVSKEELESLVEKLDSIKPKPDFLVFAGSVPPGVPKTIYHRLITMAKQNGIKTVLDCDGEWLEEGIKAVPHIIKPNVHEAQQLLGTELTDEASIIEAVGQFISRGIEIVVVSRGKDGLIISDGVETLKVTSPPVEVSSTVGAGDSAIAGLLLKLSKGEGLEEAARLAVAAGTSTALTPGTELCHREDVEKLLPMVEVKVIKG
jgi:6-phosphofructokinase 2